MDRSRTLLTRTALILLLLTLTTRPSLAVNVQQFSRSTSLSFEMLEDTRMEHSHVNSNYDAIFSFGASWVEDPFVLKSSSSGSIVGKPLPDMKNFHFGAAIYTHPWMMFGLSAGYSFFKWKTVDSNGASVDTGSGSAFSDLELKAKVRLVNEAQWALSVMPFITIPMAGGKFDPYNGDALGRNAFLSDDGIGIGTKVLAEYNFSFMQLLLNLGFKNNSSAKYGSDLDYRQMLYTGVGVYVPLSEKIGANIEFVRQWQLPLSNKQNPNEFYVGVNAEAIKGLHAFGGIGLGNLFQKNDGNSFRLSAGVKIVPVLWSSNNAAEEVSN